MSKALYYKTLRIRIVKTLRIRIVKTLRIRNVRETDKFRSKLVLLSTHVKWLNNNKVQAH